jgi:hypothetical protein
MNHIDDETLALFALGASRPTPDEQEHLDECAFCRREIEGLRRTVELGRVSQGVTLETPPPAVWDRIQADIATGDTRRVQPPAHHATPRTQAARARRPLRVRLALWIPVTAAVAVAAAVGGVVSAPLLRPDTASTPTSTVVERASLTSLPGWTGAHGTATLRRSADGRLSLTVRMTPGTDEPPSVAGPLREVWLMKRDLSGLMSMGYITSTTATFTVPDGLDVSVYSLVDVSAQAANGNPAHSGQSIMRGGLQQSG